MFDFYVDKILKEYNKNYYVNYMFKASDYSNKLYRKLKRECKKNNKVNSKQYKLDMSIKKFEVYFSKVEHFMVTIFQTKKSDQIIAYFDEMFVVMDREKENEQNNKCN